MSLGPGSSAEDLEFLVASLGVLGMIVDLQFRRGG